MEIKDLVSKLNQDVLGVCHYLLPGGKIISQEYCIGDASGEKGISLSVHLVGDKAGIWKDFSEPEKPIIKGDLFNLWRAVREGKSIVEVKREVEEYLGVKNKFLNSDSKKFPKDVGTPLREESKVMRYLTEERLLTKETVALFKVKEEVNGLNWMVFPYYKEKRLYFYKKIAVERKDGKKQIFSSSDNESTSCLFGWHTIPSDARGVVIDEGEINTMTWRQWGIPALSVPRGAGDGDKNKWLQTDFENLELFETIWIRGDNDSAGKKMSEDLIRRLGRHRCRLLILPDGDPNDYLKKGFSAEEMKDFLRKAPYQQPEEIKKPSEFLQQVIEEFYPDRHSPKGFHPRFHKLLGTGAEDPPKIEFRAGEVTLYGGYNFEGKSQLVKQMMLDAILQNEKVAFVDLEQKPSVTLYRLVKSATASPFPEHGYIQKVIEHFDDKIWVADHQGTLTLQEIQDIFGYAVKRFGVKHVFIDSLMCIKDVPSDGYDAQRMAMNIFRGFAQTYDCHVHVVAHFRKPQFQTRNTFVIPDRYEISGAGDISNLAFNVIIMVRNFPKEKILAEEMDLPKETTIEKIKAQPDAVMRIDKQKNGTNWSGNIGLFWHSESMQYLDNADKNPYIYVPLVSRMK